MRDDDTDAYGARMKAYEAVETERKFSPTYPIYARIDGRAFSKFTKGMNRPYDFAMSVAMVEVCKYLVEKTNACIGYVQSDEINLAWNASTQGTNVIFAGKIMKLTSVIASMAAAKMAQVCPEGYEDRLPCFDARIIQMPTETEVANMFLWRAMDARKNAVQSAARALVSHSELQFKNQRDMKAILCSAGKPIESYPKFFKNGTFLRRKMLQLYLTPAELANIPVDKRPKGPVDRSVVAILDMPLFNKVKNREGVIFNKEEPRFKL